MAASTTATSTINTFLMKFDGVTAKPTSADLAKAKKVVDIKSVPAMGGEPDTLETTTLSDSVATSILGVQSNDLKQFTANYIASDFMAIKAMEGTEVWFGVFLGAGADGAPDGHDGIFVWKGSITVALNEGDVNAVREMTIYINCATAPEVLETA